MREARPAHPGRAASMRRSSPSPASTLARFFARMIQAGSQWQSSQYLVDSSVRSCYVSRLSQWLMLAMWVVAW